MSFRCKNCYYICYSHNYAKIKVDSYDYLSLEKLMTFHNVIILIKSSYSNIFLEKASNKLPKK